MPSRAATGATESPAADTARRGAWPPRRRALALAFVVLSFAGFVISFYLAVTHYRNAVPPCYGTTGCESVVTSRYSVIAGVPLSLVGTVFFVVVFYLSIALATGADGRVVRAFEVAATGGALVALFLFLVQAVILTAYCIYCLGTEVAAVSIWAGSLFVRASEKE